MAPRVSVWGDSAPLYSQNVKMYSDPFSDVSFVKNDA